MARKKVNIYVCIYIYGTGSTKKRKKERKKKKKKKKKTLIHIGSRCYAAHTVELWLLIGHGFNHRAGVSIAGGVVDATNKKAPADVSSARYPLGRVFSPYRY